MTPAELQTHPGDNLLLTTNPVPSVLNQHYGQCLSNWVMFKHTQEGTSWLLRYVDTECLSCTTASICVYTHVFFLCEQRMILCVKLLSIISVGTIKHMVQKQTHGSLNLWHLTHQQFPIPQRLHFKQDQLHLFPTYISTEFFFQIRVTSAHYVQPPTHRTQECS